MPLCKPGDRIRLVNMPDDPDPIAAGSTGTVTGITGGVLGQISVTWDSPLRRRLVLIPGIDEFEVVGHSDLVEECFACPDCGNRAMDLLEWDENHETVTCSLCSRNYTP